MESEGLRCCRPSIRARLRQIASLCDHRHVARGGMYFWKPQLVHFTFGYPVTLFDWITVTMVVVRRRDTRTQPSPRGCGNIRCGGEGKISGPSFATTRARRTGHCVVLRPKTSRLPPRRCSLIAGRYELFRRGGHLPARRRPPCRRGSPDGTSIAPTDRERCHLRRAATRRCSRVRWRMPIGKVPARPG